MKVCWDGEALDEVVARRARVHLERLSEREWYVSVIAGGRELALRLFATQERKPRIRVFLDYDGPVWGERWWRRWLRRLWG